MKVLLIKDVKKLGWLGDVVEIKRGVREELSFAAGSCGSADGREPQEHGEKEGGARGAPVGRA